MDHNTEQNVVPSVRLKLKKNDVIYIYTRINMANVRYQLIEPLSPSDVNTWHIYLKSVLAMASVSLIVLYSCYNGTMDQNITIPTNSIFVSTEIAHIQREFHNSTNNTQIQKKIHNSTVPNYFVYSENCQMPAVNPFTSDVLKIFHKTAYKKCDLQKDLITVNYDDKKRRYSLHKNKENISCCYKTILRWGERTEADNLYKLMPCTNFHQDFVVPQQIDAIITECRRLKDHVLLQQDAFGFVQSKTSGSGKNASSDGESVDRRPSVLLWGIDSMSRMNFQRTMPQMFKYLTEENWYELQGYNKMADNTFPNLMAILTGFNNSRAMSVCKPTVVGFLDTCPSLWKAYKKRGYFTAYSEDWSKFATFNFNKKGFVKPPTDYYGRPLMLAVAKELKNQVNMNIPYCVGRRHYAEYVYDAALQFTKVYKNESTFGMFWTNSFSHNNFALPSSMDARVLEYMRSLNRSGILDESIIVFFSDHGMRFGSLRKLDSGFLEERMPIFYIWLPKWFREKYPEYADSLKLNRNRLTSPYDIYATLRHILELDTPRSELPLPESCPSCHSVFFKVEESRGCRYAGIDDHWCTCNSFLNVSGSDKNVGEAADQLINATNNFLAARNLTALCQPLKLSKISSVQRKINLDTKGSESYLIRYEVKPSNALFEASITWNKKSHRISIDVPDISRLDRYSNFSMCVIDKIAKKFCICSNSQANNLYK
ncbi:uncharacterized protein LOC117790600 [Drosophila innubila]|uniref:uncharacterized protein LOC117790600 n=1 Tax=Drosophila innubila TaxID=198719 RepID=UPI00148B47F5|nr:uncharacterized protein LOC117790600 [Drosophila innubila]